MRHPFYLLLGITFFYVQVLHSEPSVLSQNVKEVTTRIQDLALYPTLSKKRLYGAVTKGGAIRFDLKASESSPQSIGIGVATDGKLKEWVLTVYAGNGQNENPTILRKEKIDGESQWVFELLAPPDEITIEIQNTNSETPLSVVEIVHGYYYGYSVDKENQTKPQQPSPTKPNPTDPEKLSPNDVQNRTEFYRTPITKD
ncbi:Hypothetical protein LBF_0524 [Leptospira biflexa serovar Patoc strain 'Patoc 1 (Ames)']|uniref:Uncharacterized protein n=1 Tax=Leptospira biflexa serovar Patoc (strain Patoc 1 / ATCC 23582 / Paris) TaxID=456481 RepID=B0SJB8_LEPBP|nr:hypothetical protein [Leptospira biflexa]ABZ93062.1 Hypothetical protein LBF_0524 [Leptospira biflexa serovar Patoc strain 'Patoc 1 (Ames)']ABZ96681.1 Hypothetical protein LEPBI_I0543 [Leptospira biflexa serovar Patoc strain 'Patoc 1 (Paris)']